MADVKQSESEKLNAERNRARAEQQTSELGEGGLNMRKNVPRNVGADDPRMKGIIDKRRSGQKLSPTERSAYAGKLRADRFKSKKQREEREKGETEDKEGEKYEISLGRFLGFGFIAFLQDFVPLVMDILLAGWIVGYIMLPFTWFFYWFLIIRWAPPSLQKKFWKRSALMTVVGLIPFVGELLPEWIATAVGAFIWYQAYRRGIGDPSDMFNKSKGVAKSKVGGQRRFLL